MLIYCVFNNDSLIRNMHTYIGYFNDLNGVMTDKNPTWQLPPPYMDIGMCYFRLHCFHNFNTNVATRITVTMTIVN